MIDCCSVMAICVASYIVWLLLFGMVVVAVWLLRVLLYGSSSIVVGGKGNF